MPKKKEPKMEVVKESGVGEIQEPFVDENETIPSVDPDKIQEDIEKAETESEPAKDSETKNEVKKKTSQSQLEISKENIKKRIAELFKKMGFALEDPREEETSIGAVYNLIYLMDENWSRIKNLPEDEKGNVKFSAGFELNIFDTFVETKVAFTERHTSKTKFQGKNPSQPEFAFDKAKEAAKEAIEESESVEVHIYSETFAKVKNGDLKMHVVHPSWEFYEKLKLGAKLKFSTFGEECLEKVIISIRDLEISYEKNLFKVDGKKYKEQSHLIKQLGYDSEDEFEAFLKETHDGEFKGKIITWN